jgi:hypothetical protein
MLRASLREQDFSGPGMPKGKDLGAVFETTDRRGTNQKGGVKRGLHGPEAQNRQGLGVVRGASAARYVSRATVSRKCFFIIQTEFFGGRPRCGSGIWRRARVSQVARRSRRGPQRQRV